DGQSATHPSAQPAEPLPRAAAGVTGMTDESDPSKDAVPAGDPWIALRRLTAARIGLARSGASLATQPLLDFRLAHARARDAVHEPLDQARLVADLTELGLPVLAVASLVEDRQHYLMRPDLGRRLTADAEAALAPHGSRDHD